MKHSFRGVLIVFSIMGVAVLSTFGITLQEYVNHRYGGDPMDFDPMEMMESIVQSTNSDWDSSDFKLFQKDDMQEVLDLLTRGKPDEAWTKIQPILEANPNSIFVKVIQARIIAQMGDVRDAARLLEDVMQDAPDNQPVLIYLSNLYRLLGDNDAARKYANQLMGINPELYQPYLSLGLVAENEGRMADAIALYEEGIRRAPPSYIGVKLNLARLYNYSQQFDKTAALLEPFVDESFPDQSAHVFLGMAYMGLDRIEEAVTTYERAQAMFPNEDFSLGLGVIYRRAGRLNESIEQLENLIARQPEMSVGHAELAKSLSAAERYEAAISSLENAIALSGENDGAALIQLAEVYHRTGEKERAEKVLNDLLARPRIQIADLELLNAFYMSSNRPSDAIRVWQKGRSIYPDNPTPSIRLGLIYKAEGQYEQSIAALEEAAQLLPEDLSIKREMISALRSMDEVEKVLEMAEVIASENPDNVEFQMVLAEVYTAAGKTDESIGVYETMLSKDGNNLLALNNIANRYLDKNRLEAAEKQARRAFLLAPTSGAIMDTLGWILLKSGNIDEATQLLEKAHQSRVGDPSIAFHLGKAYQLSGESSKAKRLLEATLADSRQFPERAEAESVLAELAN